MKKKLLSAFLIISSALYAQNFEIKPGWQLKGTENNYSISQFNNSCIDLIWKYDTQTQQWQGYSPNPETAQALKDYNISEITSLNVNDGFWIKANSECNLSISNLPINNILSYNLDASKVYIKDNYIYVSNMRIESSDTDYNDSVDMVYELNPQDLSFQPAVDKIKIYKNLGIFNEDGDLPLFIKDVPHDIYMIDSDDDSNVSMGTSYNVSVIKDKTKFYFDLVAGQEPSFLIQEPSDDYTFEVFDPNGEQIYKFEGAKNYGVISDGIPIKEDGRYTVVITPSSSDTISLKLMFLNANRRDLVSVKDGDYISNSFMTNIRDYAKYQVHLNAGDKLSLPSPSDSNIELVLLDENGKIVTSGTGLPLIYTADKSGDYYICIYNSKGWGSSYYGSVSIETPTTTDRILARPATTTNVNDKVTPAQ